MKRQALSRLPSEQPNRAARDLDLLSPLEIARIINREDRKVAAAVGRALPQVARAITLIARALNRGGRLIYVGAGSSGRIAALDACECPPTFGVSPATVRYVIAGGAAALGRAREASEDSSTRGRRDLAKLRPGANDVVVGVAASGRTPYTVAAVEYARGRGARIIALTGNRGSRLAAAAHLAIVIAPGPEVVAGSSRMKAGTAQKMVLNMLSTGALAHAGYLYGNEMVNLSTKSAKLRARGLAILQRAAGISSQRAARALNACGAMVPVALVHLLAGVAPARARRELRAAGGNVRAAIARARSSSKSSPWFGRRQNASKIKAPRHSAK